MTDQQTEFYDLQQEFQQWYEQNYADKDFSTGNSVRLACMNAWQAAIDYYTYRQAQKQQATAKTAAVEMTLGELEDYQKKQAQDILNSLSGLTPDRRDLITRCVPAYEIIEGRFKQIYETTFGQWFYGEADFWRLFDRADARAGWEGAAFWLHKAMSEGLEPGDTEEFNRAWSQGFNEWYVDHVRRKMRPPKGLVARLSEPCYEGWKAFLVHELELKE